jgi:hypothetical protein
MSITIKNSETEQLARELASYRGKGLTEAVTFALRRELDRDDRIREVRRRLGQPTDSAEIS